MYRLTLIVTILVLLPYACWAQNPWLPSPSTPRPLVGTDTPVSDTTPMPVKLIGGLTASASAAPIATTTETLISVGTTSTLLSNMPGRTFAQIQNHGDVDMWLSWSGTAVVGQGWRIFPGGSWDDNFSDNIPLSIVASAATTGIYGQGKP